MILEGVWLNLQFDILTFISQCFEPTFKFRSIDAISLNGACLVRKILTQKNQIPDSFQYVIEREFGETDARAYEEYVRESNGQRLIQVEQLDAKIDFNSGIDHMNQVVSYERLVYFGYIFEKSGLLAQSGQAGKTGSMSKPQLVFGHRAVLHTESPNKIRQAGYIEMLQI